MGELISRKSRELTNGEKGDKNDIKLIADTYHNWKKADGSYEDIPGFCKSASVEGGGGVKALDYVLTPGRYIGLLDDEEDFDFAERVHTLTTQLEAQMTESMALDMRIKENLAKER